MIEDIWKAHRTGPFKQDKVRPLIIKVAYGAKELILEHMSKLKGRRNPTTKQSFFISEQIPEGIAEMRKQTSSRVKSLKEQNEKKPKEERSRITAVHDKVLVDGELQPPEVSTPQPSQLLFLSPDHQKRVNQIQQKMVKTEPEIVKSSEFIALAVKVHTVEQVNDAYIAAAQRPPAADHVMLGYAFREDSTLKTRSCDDREYGAGPRIRKTIFESKAKNMAVFVVRKFGGLHIGYNQFNIIEQEAKKAIQMLNN